MASADRIEHATSSVDEVRQLYVSLGPQLRQAMARLAPELDADDLLQEVFVVALDRTEELATAHSPRAWLFGVALKLAATRRRTSRLRRFLGLEDVQRAVAVDVASRSVEQHDAQRRVARALEALSQPKRDVFVLFELQGLPGDEIALALDVPVKTVWTRLFHARREVTAALERQLLTEVRTSGLGRDEVSP